MGQNCWAAKRKAKGGKKGTCCSTKAWKSAADTGVRVKHAEFIGVLMRMHTVLKHIAGPMAKSNTGQDLVMSCD